MKKLEIKKTLNPVSVFIVDDELDRVGMLVETVAATGNMAKYANSYESAVDGRAECYDIVACDVFLHDHDPTKGTGFDYKHSYKKIHKDAIFLMYSGNKRLVSDESLQMEVLDAMQIQDALLETIDRIDKIKTCNNDIKEEPKEEPKEEDRTSHNHHRSGDKKNFWQIQSCLLSIFLTIIAFGGTFALIKAWGQSATIPYIEKVSCRIDSLNHIPILKDIDNIRSIEKKTDTNIAIIKSILEVIATSDQLIIAEKRRTNPTGIR